MKPAQQQGASPALLPEANRYSRSVMRQGTCLSLAALFLSPWLILAATRTWDGSSSAYWGTAANWAENAVPADGDDLVFPSGPTRLATTNNTSTTRRYNSITISGADYTLRGNSLTLSNGITATYAAGSSAAVALDITLARGQTIECSTANSLLHVTGDIALGAYTLLADATGNLLFGGAISGTGGIAKYGTGYLRLYGSTANTCTGNTIVNVGRLEFNKSTGVNALAGDLFVGNNTGDPESVRWLNSAQLPSTSDVTVNTGAALELNNFNEALGALILNGGEVDTGAGLLTLGGNVTVRSNATVAVIAGNLSLGGVTRTFTLAGHNHVHTVLDLPASVRDGGGDAGINWVGLPVQNPDTHGWGVPSVSLSGSNSYDGLTLATNAHLYVRNPFALGSTNQGCTIRGVTLALYDTAVTNETLSVKSGMFTPQLQAGGTATWAGPIVLGAHLYMGKAYEGSVTNTLEIRGPISGYEEIEIWMGTNGAVIFSGSQANTHTGDTHVNSGTLLLSKTGGNAITAGELIIGNGSGGSALVRETANYQIGNIPITINSDGLLDLDLYDDTLLDLTLDGGQITTADGDLTLSGTLAVLNNADRQARISSSGAGRLVLSGTRTINIANSSYSPDLQLQVPISGTGSFAKTGAGALGLYRSNSFSGLATISDGLVYLYHDQALGTTSGGTVVADGGVLVAANGRAIGAEPLTLNGNGDGISGALASIGGSNSWSGTVTLATDSVITVQTNRYLNLAGTVAGPAGFIKAQPGALILSGATANTFAGNAVVNEGTLLLDKSVTDRALPGPGELIIGDNVGGAEADVVRELRNNQIDSSVDLTVNVSGLLDLNDHSDTLGNLRIIAGTIETGSGLLSLEGDVTATHSGFEQGFVYGRLALLGATRTFDVSSTGSHYVPILAIDADISGPAGLFKAGSGDLGLRGSNSYSGLTTVAEGDLLVLADTALGTTAAGTVVERQGSLHLGSIYNKNIHVGNEALTISGSLIAAGGWSTSNSWSGPITLATNITLGAYGTGFLNLIGPVGGPGGFTESGFTDGTVILSGSAPNTYTGQTEVRGSLLVLDKSSADGAIPGNLFVRNNPGGSGTGVVLLKRDNQIANTAAVTISTSTALDLNGRYDRVDAVTGSGSITLGSGHLIAGHSGSSFTFDGLVFGTGYLWKVGSGTWTLTADNTYLGTTRIETGTLLINGSQPASDVLVQSAGTLGGIGTVGRVTSTGGALSPGLSPGTLTSSNLLFDSSSDFIVELGSAASDQLNVKGKAALANASLILSAPGLLPSEGQQFTILSNDDTDAITGTFSGLAEGALVSAGPRQFRISYAGNSGNDIVLTATNTAALRPTLTVWHTNTNMVGVSWPSSDIAWLLHATTNLSATPVFWTEISPPYQTNGTDLEFIEPALAGDKFYRLQKP
jgi:autotransporter-associated beta strand protein